MSGGKKRRPQSDSQKLAVIKANQEMVRDYKPDTNEATANLPGDLIQFGAEGRQQESLLCMAGYRPGRRGSIARSEGGHLRVPGSESGPLSYSRRENEAGLDAGGTHSSHQGTAARVSVPDGLKDEKNPKNIKLSIRDNAHALGEEVPRGSRPFWARPMDNLCRSRKAAVEWN